MSIATELERMEQAEREATGGSYRQMVSAKADGKTVDLQKLREVLRSLGLEPKRFDADVAAVLTLRREIDEAKGLVELRARHREAAQAAAAHDQETVRYQAEAAKTGERLHAEVAAIGAEVNRLMSIRDRLVKQGHIAE